MITYIQGDLFESPAKVLVNTVNTVGVMGKGIALQFKKIYPDMFEEYRIRCEKKELQIGDLLLFKTENKWILNFPTKKHWRNPSKVRYIEAGLQKLSEKYAELGITAIALPELGCGNGELNFESQVKPLMELYLSKLTIPVFIHLYDETAITPEHKNIPEIASWLRSEPFELPFDEVWQDVVNVLIDQRIFHTEAMGNIFAADALEDSHSIHITVNGKARLIGREELVDFWQQLRDFGLTHGGIAPEHRFLSYLIPIFGQLPYVNIVHLANSYERFMSNPKRGVQLGPIRAPRSGELFADQV